jgi:hypothetical protein
VNGYNGGNAGTEEIANALWWPVTVHMGVQRTVYKGDWDAPAEL